MLNVLTIAMLLPRELQLRKCYNTYGCCTYFDHVDCSVVCPIRTVIYQCDSIEPLYENSCHVLPHIVMPFLNILRSFRACVHVCVFVHAYESGRNQTHSCVCVFIIRTFLR